MMKKRGSALSLAVLLVSTAVAAQAQDQTYDTRSLALGGTGVAIANTRNAAFMNPSLLASKDEDKFALELPIVSARVLDEQNLLSDADNLKTVAGDLNNALTNLKSSTTPTPTDAADAKNKLTSFKNALTGISGKELNGGAFVGTMLAIPSKKFSFALTADERAEFGARANYVASDATTISQLDQNLTDCGNGIAAGCTAAKNQIASDGSVTGLASSIDVRGIVAKDLGITMARHFDEWAGTDIGITPKITQLQTYDLKVDAQNRNYSILNNTSSYTQSIFNFDLGVSKSFKKTDDHEFKAGFVVKDVMSRTIRTVLDNEIDIKPRATVGIGYLTKLTTTGVDLDVVSNKPLISGFSQESQFLRFGAEFDVWKWAQIRVGYRHDLKGNYKDLPSVGLGLSPFGVHIDLSVAYANKSEVAAAMQLGMHF